MVLADSQGKTLVNMGPSSQKDKKLIRRAIVMLQDISEHFSGSAA
jgi:hypothetical protein